MVQATTWLQLLGIPSTTCLWTRSRKETLGFLWGSDKASSLLWSLCCRPHYGPPTFAQVIGAHKTGFGGPGPDALPSLVLRAPESAKENIPFALVFEALAVGIVTSPGACGQGTQGCKSRKTHTPSSGSLQLPLYLPWYVLARQRKDLEIPPRNPPHDCPNRPGPNS